MLGSAILAGMKGPIAIPPASKADLTPGAELAHRLAALLGKPFSLTGKTRTDGANLRKTVGRVLEETTTLPIPAAEGAWRIVPPKKKGVPRLLREFADTYIVTSGTSYNLQVWNRNPSEPIPQIEYGDGSLLQANDVRFILVRVERRSPRRSLHHCCNSGVYSRPLWEVRKTDNQGTIDHSATYPTAGALLESADTVLPRRSFAISNVQQAHYSADLRWTWLSRPRITNS